MSRSDRRAFFAMIERVRSREATRDEEVISGLGISVAAYTGAAFREWRRTAEPNEIVPAFQEIAAQRTPAQKLLKAAKIAGVWE